MIKIVTPIRKRAQRGDPSDWNPSEDEFEYLGEQTPEGEFIPANPADWNPSEDEFDYLGERTPEGEFIPAKPSDFQDDFQDLEPTEEPEDQAVPPVQRTYTPYVSKPRQITPISPEEVLMGQEVPIPMGDIERMNAELSVRQKIVHGLLNGIPLRIRYLTLDGMSQTERTIYPDYVYWAGTGRHILVAMDEMSGDWRAFAVSNIEVADLEPEE